jgi:hypothetical protein
MKYFCLAAAAMMFGLAFGIVPAWAQNVTCSGVLSGTFGNVTVPRNQVCAVPIRSALTVTGNFSIEPGGSLVMDDLGFLTIDGNLTATNASTITLESGSLIVHGNITSVNSNVVDIFTTGFSTIGGNVTIVGSSGTVFVAGATIGGNVTVVDNTTTTGANSDTIGNNSISGNLVCVNNTPAPTNQGASNKVGGNRVLQCAGL